MSQQTKTISVSDLSYKVMNEVWPQCKDMTVFEYIRIRESLLIQLTIQLSKAEKVIITP